MKLAVETNKSEDQLRKTARDEPVRNGMETNHGKTKVSAIAMDFGQTSFCTKLFLLTMHETGMDGNNMTSEKE